MTNLSFVPKPAGNWIISDGRKRPSWWVRIWTRFLLGWRWEDTK